MRRVSSWPVAVVAAAVLMATALPAHAALATGTTAADADDTTTPVDIRTATVGGDAKTAEFTIVTWNGFNDSDTYLNWAVDVPGEPSPEFVVAAGWNGTGLTGLVSPVGAGFASPVTVSRVDATTIKLSFPRAAIGGATNFSWALQTWFDSNADKQQQTSELDSVPDDAGARYPTIVDRVAGEDRVGTSVAVSRDLFADDQAAAAVLTRSDGFADALAGAPLAVAKQGPLLLTNSKSLDNFTETELNRVLPQGATVYLLGGDTALAPAISDRVKKLGFNPVRIAGADRFDTAVRIARDALGNPNLLLVTTGVDFPDALSAGAAAGGRRGAVLLTNGSSMPAVVTQYVQEHPQAQRFSVGGPAATADPGATPLVGNDRYETSVKVAGQFFPRPLSAGVSSGVSFADALAGGAHAGHLSGPLLLTLPSSLPDTVRSYLNSGISSIVRASVFGGTAAVDDNVVNQIAAALS